MYSVMMIQRKNRSSILNEKDNDDDEEGKRTAIITLVF